MPGPGRDVWLSGFFHEGRWVLRLSLTPDVSVQYVSEVGETLPECVRKLEQMRERELAKEAS